MNPRIIFITLLLLFFVAACGNKTEQKTQEKTLDFGVFKLTAPAGWKQLSEQGIDTYVGGLTDGRDTLHFGYGHYNEDMSEFSDEKMKYAADTVNGLRANIGLSVVPGKLAVVMITVNKEDQFIMHGTDLKRPDITLGIFRSLVFEESDTSENRMTPVDSFTSRVPVSGKSLFGMNCMSCHSLNREIVGPVLSERIKIRSDKWIYQFLSDRASVSSDTGHIQLKKKYGFECVKFPNLTEEELWALIDYIKTK